MIQKAVCIMISLSLTISPLFAERPVNQTNGFNPPLTFLQTEPEFTEELPEDPIARMPASTKLLIGLSLSIVGTGLTVLGGVYAPQSQAAQVALEAFDPATGSIADLERLSSEARNLRLLYLLPFISGLSMAGIGLVLTFDGAFGIEVYEQGPYSPAVNTHTPSGTDVIVSPSFTGIRIR